MATSDPLDVPRVAAPAPLDVSRLFSLHSKTAIVTGGTGGLGVAMTTALASAGADVISIELPNDPNSKALEDAVKACGRNIKRYECDVGNMQEIRKVYGKVWEDGGEGDVLLNCAGVQRRANAEEFTDEDIDAVIDINLKATLVSCQEFAKRRLQLEKKGKIINIASIISFIGGKNITPYAASKGGVLQLTKAFSNEWAGRGINCNCIHPGYMRTAMTEQYSTDPKYKDFNNYVLSRLPAQRWGEPSDLQGAIVFLATAASDYVSGTSIVVDGGFLGM